MKTPKIINELYLECTCVGIGISKWDEFMEGSTKANKKIIDNCIKNFLPELYESLALDLYNPYNYYKTKNHLVMVHSSIEYFLKYS